MISIHTYRFRHRDSVVDRLRSGRLHHRPHYCVDPLLLANDICKIDLLTQWFVYILLINLQTIVTLKLIFIETSWMNDKRFQSSLIKMALNVMHGAMSVTKC